MTQDDGTTQDDVIYEEFSLSLDDIATFLTNFDWISPSLAIAMDIAHGGGCTFLIDRAGGWTGREIAQLLRSNDIYTWGHMIVNGCIMLTVDPENGQEAAEILAAAGLGTSGPAPQEEKEAQWEGQQQQGSWQPAWESVSPFS